MWPFRRRSPTAATAGKSELGTSPPQAICSFCGKNQDEVRTLIAGPTVYICSECIDLCNDIIAEEAPRTERRCDVCRGLLDVNDDTGAVEK